MQFSLEKRLGKRKWIHPTHYNNSRWIVSYNSVIDSSILQEILSSVSKCLSWNRKNRVKKNGW